MKKAYLIIILLGILYQVGRSATADNSVVTGTWKCAVTDVPNEYSNSLITFIEKEGKLSGSVKFDSGEEIKLSTVRLTNGQLLLTLYVEGYSISVDGKVNGEKIAGVIDTPDGKVNFTASRVPEDKK